MASSGGHVPLSPPPPLGPALGVTFACNDFIFYVTLKKGCLSPGKLKIAIDLQAGFA